MHLMPDAAAASTPSRNGKKASDARAAPSSDNLASSALRQAIRAENTRLV